MYYRWWVFDSIHIFKCPCLWVHYSHPVTDGLYCITITLMIWKHHPDIKIMYKKYIHLSPQPYPNFDLWTCSRVRIKRGFSCFYSFTFLSPKTSYPENPAGSDSPALTFSFFDIRTTLSIWFEWMGSMSLRPTGYFDRGLFIDNKNTILFYWLNHTAISITCMPSYWYCSCLVLAINSLGYASLILSNESISLSKVFLVEKSSDTWI